MAKIKVSPTRIVIAGAVQIVITTIGFILYRRPYLWALTAIEWYSEVYCGTTLDKIRSRFNQMNSADKSKLRPEYEVYKEQCAENYLESFTDMFYDKCFFNAKAAFVSIPIVSTMIILSIIMCLHWAPFHKKTLKKPVFMLALLLSLILVAVNIGQIITMIVPLINAHATPDSVASSRVNDRVMKCGVGAEATALVLMLLSSALSMMISFFIIRLYVMRIKGQKENLTDERLRIETLEEYEEMKMFKKAKAKAKKKSKFEHQETVYLDANDHSFGSQKSLDPRQHHMQGKMTASSPKSQGIPFAGAH